MGDVGAEVGAPAGALELVVEGVLDCGDAAVCDEGGAEVGRQVFVGGVGGGGGEGDFFRG